MSNFNRGGRSYESGDVNSYLIDKHLDEEDERAEMLEEFNELSKQFFDNIEEALFHIRNKAESFSDIDLEDEIKSRVMELLWARN